MTTQPLARSTDPTTSHDAAASARAAAPTIRAAVLAALRSHGPMTDEELLHQLHRDGVRCSPSGARTRRAELVRAGQVEDSGEVALTASGRRTIIWQEATT